MKINGLVAEFSIDLDKALKAIPSILREIEEIVKVDVTKAAVEYASGVDWESEFETYADGISANCATLAEGASNHLEAECYDAFSVFAQCCAKLSLSRVSDPEAIKESIAKTFDTIVDAFERSHYFSTTTINVNVEWIDTRLNINLCFQGDGNKFWSGFELGKVMEFKDAVDYISGAVQEETNIFWKMLKKVFPTLNKRIETKLLKPALADKLLSYGATEIMVI